MHSVWKLYKKVSLLQLCNLTKKSSQNSHCYDMQEKIAKVAKIATKNLISETFVGHGDDYFCSYLGYNHLLRIPNGIGIVLKHIRHVHYIR